MRAALIILLLVYACASRKSVAEDVRQHLTQLYAKKLSPFERAVQYVHIATSYTSLETEDARPLIELFRSLVSSDMFTPLEIDRIFIKCRYYQYGWITGQHILWTRASRRAHLLALYPNLYEKDAEMLRTAIYVHQRFPPDGLAVDYTFSDNQRLIDIAIEESNNDAIRVLLSAGVLL